MRGEGEYKREGKRKVFFFLMFLRLCFFLGKVVCNCKCGFCGSSYMSVFVLGSVLGMV